MKNKKRELTKPKVIGSIIAGLLIIAIQVKMILDINPDSIQDIWQEIALIIVAFAFSLFIVIHFYSQKNGG